MSSIYVHNLKELPDGEHWVILCESSVIVPGDDRSRTNPGHGYPESTTSYLIYEAFKSEAEFRIELQRRLEAKYSNKYCGIHVAGVFGATTEVKIVEKK